MLSWILLSLKNYVSKEAEADEDGRPDTGARGKLIA